MLSWFPTLPGRIILAAGFLLAVGIERLFDLPGTVEALLFMLQFVFAAGLLAANVAATTRRRSRPNG